jgi:hypothetical protein
MSKIYLNNVRLSFPKIFNKATFEGKETKFEATLLIPKSDTATKAVLDEAIKSLLAEAKMKVGADKICLKDGDDSDYDGYEGNWSLKASNSKRPTLVNKDKTPIVEEDNILYAGCYVNAIIDLWAQNNGYGKRVNANLLGIQFVKDGDSFEGSKVADEDDFDDLGDL